MATTATRKILNTGTNKYQSAFRQMQRAIYSDNVYVSLNANTLTTTVRNDLDNLNQFWMTSCYLDRVVRDNYRLCFSRRDWQKSNVYDRFDPTKEPQEQNCYVFDPTIGDGVLFLCVGNNQFNRSDISTASVYKPSTGYTSVDSLPSTVIELDDGYSWIALAQSDTRFTDSNWISLEIRDGISFFGSDTGVYVDDGLTLSDFKTAVSSPFNPGDMGAAGFYPVLNSYDQTEADEVESGDVLYSFGNILRFDVFKMQQALKISGIDTQINFVTGGTSGATASLPNSITIKSIYEQIKNSPFSSTSPLGWYNDKVSQWSDKAGSVEMVYLDMTDIKKSDLIVNGITRPSISVKGNGTSPEAEFIVARINDNTWEIRGAKISTNLATNERIVGKDNTRVEFEVSDTQNNDSFENALRGLITPYGGLLTEDNLYGQIIPVNAFMMSKTIDEDKITSEVDFTAGKITGPRIFDSYGLIVDAKGFTDTSNNTYERELGLDLPPNKEESIGNLIFADLTPSSGTPVLTAGMLIYEGNPKVGGTAPRGELLGIVQAVESPQPLAARYVAISTSNTSNFTNGSTFYIGSGSSFSLFTQSTKATKVAATPLTGTIMHIGNSRFDISSGTKKRISIKYITRV